mmetsp:Transcript_19120/g.45307  ORF Transcript_19120/g.45307 Transcript_19120/m.45307 type:complete len:121 (+) Transcript_19120:44-406(+)
MMRAAWVICAILAEAMAVEVAVEFNGAETHGTKQMIRRERRRYECSSRKALPECPSSREGKAACDAAKVAQGSTKHSPCLWTAADGAKNTPDMCSVDTYDPCYDEDPYDEGRGPGQWPDT